ncbi:helix-turn-helix domain-containing protein [Cryptosporangium phraense]|uniref:Helix-turn-helix domain-containing protein n=1 Tax=Cryptosporangium phraense TaxID=2593070 RepID=A0A545AIH6_9ACTN|nr:XRE family transcriptional regulator [Cryptosporangium phraense]TQS41119.1 helix-turn-helix domain-containing protein [Cryptosporangium phraense]
MTHAEAGERLGDSVRKLRKDKGMTLVELARAADLSHSFLSQLERGLSRPSMSSLHRIAQALGTTQPALMAAAEAGRAKVEVSLIRAGEGMPLENPGGTGRTLVAGSHALYPMLFVGAPDEWGDWYTHPAEEFIHVIAGSILVQLDAETHELLPGDTLYYPGDVPHRWRGVRGYGAETARLLFVQEGRR